MTKVCVWEAITCEKKAGERIKIMLCANPREHRVGTTLVLPWYYPSEIHQKIPTMENVLRMCTVYA